MPYNNHFERFFPDRMRTKTNVLFTFFRFCVAIITFYRSNNGSNELGACEWWNSQEEISNFSRKNHFDFHVTFVVLAKVWCSLNFHSVILFGKIDCVGCFQDGQEQTRLNCLTIFEAMTLFHTGASVRFFASTMREAFVSWALVVHNLGEMCT